MGPQGARQIQQLYGFRDRLENETEYSQFVTTTPWRPASHMVATVIFLDLKEVELIRIIYTAK
jgi:hypothetical protein